MFPGFLGNGIALVHNFRLKSASCGMTILRIMSLFIVTHKDWQLSVGRSGLGDVAVG